jgi:hypothetical protein
MIGPGWLPRHRPRALKRPTLAYTRLRRRRASRRSQNQARDVQAVNTEDMLFDSRPAELPVATVRSSEPRARTTAILAGLQQWVRARWQWFKPRTVPVAVAALGMFAMIEAAEYLAHAKGEPTCSMKQHPVHVGLATR